MSLPTIERLRELFRYDESSPSGLVWAIAPRSRRKAGDVAGSKIPAGYWLVQVDGKRLYAHRVIWALATWNWPSGEIDHIEDKSNKVANLREATRNQNLANMRRMKRNRSGYKGVSWKEDCRKWQAHISIDGEHQYLGLFDNPEDAHEAYYRAALEAFGEFARRA